MTQIKPNIKHVILSKSLSTATTRTLVRPRPPAPRDSQPLQRFLTEITANATLQVQPRTRCVQFTSKMSHRGEGLTPKRDCCFNNKAQTGAISRTGDAQVQPPFVKLSFTSLTQQLWHICANTQSARTVGRGSVVVVTCRVGARQLRGRGGD